MRPPTERTPLPRSFYRRPTLEVAPDLLGRIVVCRRDGRRAAGRIVETEAYLGRQDPASHAYRGPTPRAEVMFGPPGHLYVYLSYGIHHCMNVVTATEGEGGAVLIRAIEPVSGTALMHARRGRDDPTDLGSGPGKLTRALGVDREQNGLDLCDPPAEDDAVWLVEGESPASVVRTPRIGISVATEVEYRFCAEGNPHLSR